MYWNRLTSPEIGKLSPNTVVVVGVASCEQHAEYLPTGTDEMLLDALLAQTEATMPRDVVILPMIKYGFSDHHFGFSGTISLCQNTLIAAMVDICKSIRKSGFEKIVFVNSHGGNQSALQVAVNLLGAEYKIYPITLQYWNLATEEISKIRESKIGGMGHACELETSLMMHYFPELVVPHEITSKEAEQGNVWLNPDMFAAKKVFRFKEFDKMSHSGNIGQPQFADAEKGKLFADCICGKLQELITFYRDNAF